MLSEIRISRACQLLQTTEESIELIARKVGYTNISNFNRSFKQIVGTTPLMYRRRMI
ncbi:helix-turn-helix domain-containing protein [Niabella insulamsoli]|uniref:helix-turn-helix domain-containing protein n=1 Tax=Niabella insulamsoli TaxID=3144874 RepID=UPI003CCC6B94